MTLNAADVAAKALAAVQSAGGTTATVTTYASSYDATTGINTRTPTQHSSVECSPVVPHTREINQSLRPGVVGFVYVPAKGLAFAPVEGQTWLISGETYTALSVETSRVADTSVLYTVALRGGGAE